ncbi:glycosyltransferase involved in cell wall biosynthesis [Friedmanniella endophytica]|uniref:Glycosyltransferase involved in cell wall biosynthesis n=1 Tax=Microlunatus kandeliicorticis TaxID=1759536 RepID=A0A7W3P4B9_9ACTN|nr:glycosyltransferase family 4 protein [Microlunatus kandeliicorticis]MBA8792703.1 glycosyltransferase involved in cell wall biosynthesis [Microlunatus kandeliicorticis]
MRILVYPHDLEIGGSQLNAVEIAAEMAASGHEVAIFGRPGRLLDRIDELGLEFIEAPNPRRRPSPAVVRALSALVTDRGFEILHGYEWPPSLECWLAAVRHPSVRAVSTVMSMAVAPFIPQQLDLVVGTEQIAASERERGRRRVSVIEPPVDLRHADDCTTREVDTFHRTHDLDGTAVTVVIVARLVPELKLEGLLTAIDVVGAQRPGEPRAQLVVVGGGSAEAEVRTAAETANRRAGRAAVVVTGELKDPRPAYAAADIVLGMGGSALRAMAHHRPLIVQGEHGFWRTLTPESLLEFRWTGWYGVGAGRATGADRLAAELIPLLRDPAGRARLGDLGRSLVEQHYSLQVAAQLQEQIYRSALAGSTGTGARLQDGVLSGVRYVGHKTARRWKKLRGRHRTDDFNSRPVASLGPKRPAVSG